MPLHIPVINKTKSTKAPIGNVGYVRPDQAAAAVRWKQINDTIAGQDVIKAGKDKYLPIPDLDVKGKVTDPRYINYLSRALYYNVIGRTLIGLVGQVFARETIITLPSGIEMLEDDVGGDGVSLEQQAKKSLEHVLSLGRAGLLTDFPTTEKPVSKADAQEGDIRPIIKLYRPENIINWRTTRVGAKTKLSLVVLKEAADVDDDGFEVKTVTAYRVLRLTDGAYTTQVYTTSNEEGGGELEAGKIITPKQGNGEPFNVIPFQFMGPENNDVNIDAAPLYAMSNVNIAHYRNSADFEDTCFVTGQPTPYFSGLTEEWVKNVMHGKAHLGSRGGIMLPKGGQAGLLQANPNNLPLVGMEHKEKQMVALGAKLVEESTIRRTATEARQDEASETSVLSSSTKNVNNAYDQALLWAQMFTTDSGEIIFTINSDFDISNLTPAERQELVAEWQAEAITWTEMRTALKRTRVAFEDDNKARTDIAANPPITIEEPADDDDGSSLGGGAPDE